MSDFVGGGEHYPGQALSVPQLLHAAGRKLENTVLGGRITTTLNQKEVDALVQDALEVLVIAQSIKNTFAPVNRIPPEVLSLIPDYCKTDEELVALTHVCRRWRAIFISRASLWTSLNCTSYARTRAYLERSRTSPLMIRIEQEQWGPHISDEAFQLMISHVGRIKALTLSAPKDTVHWHTQDLVSPAPLLERLEIRVKDQGTAAPEPFELFSGDLPSLRELLLCGIVTNLPRQNVSNLTTFDFRQTSNIEISIAHLLAFFESAHLLREIKLMGSLAYSSDALPDQILSLPHLRLLRIRDQRAHSVLLNHLHIPTGASVTLEFECSDEDRPIQDYLPRSLENLGNISHITSINLDFGSWKTSLRLNGPSGGMYMIGTWEDEHQILPSLRVFPLSTVERLSITGHEALADPETEGLDHRQTLLLADNLRTLTLTGLQNLPFILALNPGHNASDTVVCPKLEEFVLYIQRQGDESCIEALSEMAKERASRGAKLSTVVIVCPQELIAAEGMFGLDSCVSHVERRLYEKLPEWDDVPGEVSGIADIGKWWD